MSEVCEKCGGTGLKASYADSTSPEVSEWRKERDRLVNRMHNVRNLDDWNIMFEDLKIHDGKICEEGEPYPCGSCYGCVGEGVGPF